MKIAQWLIMGALLVSLVGCGSNNGVSDANLHAVGFGHGTFVAVGDGGEIATSSDGASWTSQSSGVTTDLLGVTYGGNKFVVVGSSGTVLLSSDGTAWSATTVSNSVSFLGVAYGDGTFVIVGKGGSVYTSTDGANWTSQESGTSSALEAITFASMFIAVGNDGTILTSLRWRQLVRGHHQHQSNTPGRSLWKRYVSGGRCQRRDLTIKWCRILVDDRDWRQLKISMGLAMHWGCSWWSARTGRSSRRLTPTHSPRERPGQVRALQVFRSATMSSSPWDFPERS